MSRGTNQKFKFTYLMKIMLDKTDENHSLNMSQIIAELEKYDITAERKSIYQDFQDMTDRFGVEIMKEQIGRETYYHVASREFELAEVKLLIDAIQSSKFITQTKSRELIGKIKGFVSEYDAKQLQRQVFITDRVKNMNESVYYNVDAIHTAINDNKKIKFKYYKWDTDKKLVPTHDGDWITVSPWALMWEDEYYYMVAYDDVENIIKHYRVDKMMRMTIEEESRAGKDVFKNFDMAKYSKATFGMYHGKKTNVKIQFNNDIVGVFIDRFGKDISIRPVDEKHSEINVEVYVSNQFFGWIVGLGNHARIEGPQEVKIMFKDYIERISQEYI